MPKITPPELTKPNKRGWIFDELIKVGQLEAAMAHNDEEVHSIRVKLEGVNEVDDITKLSDELALNEDIIKLDYENRVDSLNSVFDNIPNSNRHYYCQVKHRSTALVIAAENFHARGCPADAEDSLHRAFKSLALTCSLAFGFEPMECMRCLDEALKKSFNVPTNENKSEPITVKID